MTKKYVLYGEQDGQFPLLFGQYDSPEQAKLAVEEFESFEGEKKWPEAMVPVLTDMANNGKSWYLDNDEWIEVYRDEIPDDADYESVVSDELKKMLEDLK